MKAIIRILTFLAILGLNFSFAQNSKNEVIATVLGGNSFQYKRVLKNTAIGVSGIFNNNNISNDNSESYISTFNLNLLIEVRKKPIEKVSTFGGISIGINKGVEYISYKSTSSGTYSEYNSDRNSISAGIYLGTYYHFSKRLFLVANFQSNLVSNSNSKSIGILKSGNPNETDSRKSLSFGLDPNGRIGIGFNF